MVVVFVPMVYILTVRFSTTGAAVAWVFLNIAYVVTVPRLMHRRLLRGEMRDWYTKDLLKPLAAGAVTALALKALMPTQADTLPTLVGLGVSLASILIVCSVAADRVRGELTRRLGIVLGRAP
jgi:O-antigen/teichoic acid export membrane protein